MRDLSLLAAFRDTPFEIKLYGQHGDGSNGIFFVPTPLDNPIDRATHLSGEIHQSLPSKALK